MKFINKIKCKLGIHSWKYGTKVKTESEIPKPPPNYKPTIIHAGCSITYYHCECKYCGTKDVRGGDLQAWE